ncbi:uncharacterized protein LOC131154165 isoform X2 [Malania oleifera]|uniref:uncharacterized protein LOC131154165 isoform X2 n=1 Tax=Malania oleifera TaxID=397392 RepID=UPI0025AE25EF|nr:uncharacterized protein LOC131154165 isoform X2 [Malania oleifera]
MVIAGVTEEGQSARKFMAMGPERSKPLHNFSLGCLKWGNQRLLRCVKVNSEGGVSAADSGSPGSGTDKSSLVRRGEDDFEKRGSLYCSETFMKSPSPAAGIESLKRPRIESDGDDGIEAVRAKLLFDLQAAADKMKVALVREGQAAEEESATAARPWNLRTRRAACKAPAGGGGGGGGKSFKVDESRPGLSPLKSENKFSMSRGIAASPEKKERRKFTIPLSRQEIEEDYYAILVHRPPRRPKKRAKIVQKQIDTLFPGSWLTEITADTYKVPDFPETSKKL